MFAVTWVVLLSCTGIALRRSVCVSHAFMCVDDWSVFRCAKIVLQIRKGQVFVVTTVYGSAAVLTVAKSSRQRKVRCVHTMVGIPTEQNEMQADAREAAAKPGAWLGMRAWPGTAGTTIAVQSLWQKLFAVQ